MSLKIKDKIRNRSLQTKMTSISLFVNILVLIVNVALLIGIDDMSDRMDTVYQGNIQLNRLSNSLEGVQNSMTEYLNTKTSDSLEDYYRNENDYRSMVYDLSDEISGETFSRMERNIKIMSEKYLDVVSQTIEAKRGRNVEKYRIRYENATELYEYIKMYIYSLNNEQFKTNSVNYSEMLSVLKIFEMISNLTMVLVIILGVILTTRLTADLIRPIKRLKEQADEVGKGNFDIEPLKVETNDEVGVVTGAFNQMTVSIQEYVQKLKTSMEAEQKAKENELMMEAHLKDAELRYLQAQINPHFLFNTLNAGAQLAMMEGADKTYNYVHSVGEFFRYNVKKGYETVTLGEELELIDNYIYILNVRFSGEIHFDKIVDESLLKVEMPGMILQPLVENCVNHGIREMMGEGRILLEVKRVDNLCCISIRDNGKGISREMLEKILNGTLAKERALHGDSNGVGMDNCIARLRLFCKNDNCISILSDGENCGTEINIYLDINETED